MNECEVCRLPLEEDGRPGSRFDRVCNLALNPRDGSRDGTRYEDRRDQLRALHRRLRGTKPGWGQYAVYDLGAMAMGDADWE